MPSITREKIQSINSKCWNGWELDTEYYMIHGEKTLIKDIQTDNEHFLRFKLEYNHSNQVILRISKYFQKQEENFAVTDGLGKSKILDERKATKKNLNNLINFTEKLTNAKLLEINANTEVTKGFGLFLPSEDF